jgi:hypothetical protein
VTSAAVDLAQVQLARATLDVLEAHDLELNKLVGLIEQLAKRVEATEASIRRLGGRA